MCVSLLYDLYEYVLFGSRRSRQVSSSTMPHFGSGATSSMQEDVPDPRELCKLPCEHPQCTNMLQGPHSGKRCTLPITHCDCNDVTHCDYIMCNCGGHETTTSIEHIDSAAGKGDGKGDGKGKMIDKGKAKDPSREAPNEYRSFCRQAKNHDSFPVGLQQAYKGDKLDLFNTWRR